MILHGSVAEGIVESVRDITVVVRAVLPRLPAPTSRPSKRVKVETGCGNSQRVKHQQSAEARALRTAQMSDADSSQRSKRSSKTVKTTDAWLRRTIERSEVSARYTASWCDDQLQVDSDSVAWSTYIVSLNLFR